MSGGVVLRNAAEDLKLESVSGDIEVEADRLIAVLGHSISGDVDISGTLASTGIVEFDTVSGNIRLRMPDASDARFNFHTGAGGSIRNRLTGHKPSRSKYARDETLKFASGEEGYAGGGVSQLAEIRETSEEQQLDEGTGSRGDHSSHRSSSVDGGMSRGGQAGTSPMASPMGTRALADDR